MNIQKKIWLTFSGSIVIICLVILSLYINDRHIEKNLAEKRISEDITLALFNRNVIITDYFINKSDRAEIQFKKAEEYIDKAFKAGKGEFLSPLKAEVFGNLLRSREKVKKNAQDLINQQNLGHEQKVLLINKLLVQSQESADFAHELSVISLNDIVRIQRVFNYSSLGAMIVILFITLVLMITIMRKIVKPIVALQEGAKLIGRGNLKHKIRITHNDELGKLARSFNDMAAKLKNVYEGLEQKVQQRTKELALAKAKDEAILENMGDGLFFIDKDKNIELANRAAQVMLGWRSGQIFRKQWDDVIQLKNENGKNVTPNVSPLEKILSGKKQTTMVAVEDGLYLTRKDGTTFPVAMTASRIKIDNENAGSLVVFRDITRELQIDKAKTEFVSLASHQLRTPLASIGWFSEMLLDGDAGEINEEQKKYLTEVYQGNERMIALVNALLNVSRLELGTFVVDPSPTDIIKLAYSVMDELKLCIDEKELTLKTNFQEKLPTLQADQKMLRIVIQNLLSNAVKYCEKGGEVTINVSADPKDETMHISISDTGMGIPKKQQKHIFTKLFRADNAKESDREGTGLGLYITKCIIDHSGGKIGFESEEGKGTTFHMSLPLKGMKKKSGNKSLA